MPIVKPNNVDMKSVLLPYVPGPSSYCSETNFFQSAFPLEFNLITGATATMPAGTTYEWNTLGRNYHAIQVASTSGTYNATVLLEGTLDGVNWFAVQSITTAGIVQLTGLYHSLRVSIPSYTSGTINVTAITQRT